MLSGCWYAWHNAKLHTNNGVNEDMWIKDSVDLYIREIRQKAEGIDTLYWQEDSKWTFIGNWGQDFAMSSDSDEGIQTLNLALN